MLQGHFAELSEKGSKSCDRERSREESSCFSDGSFIFPSLPILQEILAGEVGHVHKRLLDAYRGDNSTQLADIPDDGYIMQNAGHHLVHGQQLPELKKLLTRPAWLECKLISYGVASVVADFRSISFLYIHTLPLSE